MDYRYTTKTFKGYTMRTIIDFFSLSILELEIELSTMDKTTELYNDVLYYYNNIILHTTSLNNISKGL